MAVATNDRLMTPEEAACYLGLKVQTLANWRATRRVSIPYSKPSARAVRYRLRDLDAFIESRTIGGAVTSHESDE